MEHFPSDIYDDYSASSNVDHDQYSDFNSHGFEEFDSQYDQFLNLNYADIEENNCDDVSETLPSVPELIDPPFFTLNVPYNEPILPSIVIINFKNPLDNAFVTTNDENFNDLCGPNENSETEIFTEPISSDFVDSITTDQNSNGITEEISKGETKIKKTAKVPVFKTSHKFACKECIKTFATNENLQKHYRNRHTLLKLKRYDEPSATSPKNIEQPTRVISSPDEATKTNKSKPTTSHIKPFQFVRPFTCTDCNKSYGNKKNLSIHRRRIHSKTKPHACIVCGFTFTYKSELKKHLNRHLLKTHYCQDCGKSFVKESALKLHLREHRTPKIITCGMCNKIFSNISNLKIHSMIHTNAKPFECSVCGIGFRFRSNMIRHELRHEVQV